MFAITFLSRSAQPGGVAHVSWNENASLVTVDNIAALQAASCLSVLSAAAHAWGVPLLLPRCSSDGIPLGIASGVCSFTGTPNSLCSIRWSHWHTSLREAPSSPRGTARAPRVRASHMRGGRGGSRPGRADPPNLSPMPCCAVQRAWLRRPQTSNARLAQLDLSEQVVDRRPRTIASADLELLVNPSHQRRRCE